MAPVLGPMLLALPFPLAQELDARAVHQQVRRRVAGAIAQLHLQALLASAHRAEIRHRPVQIGQRQQALQHAKALAQRLPEQAFDAQAELDRRVRERLIATPLAIGLGQPLHVLVQSHRQQASRLQRRVVLRPVRRAVAAPHFFAFTHRPSRPSGWGPLCNKALLEAKANDGGDCRRVCA